MFLFIQHIKQELAVLFKYLFKQIEKIRVPKYWFFGLTHIWKVVEGHVKKSYSKNALHCSSSAVVSV